MNSQFSVLDIKGIPGARRDRVKAAVVAAGSHLAESYEAWIVPARRPPAYSVRVIGPRGFYREIQFAGHEDDAEITERTRQALPIEITA